MPSTLADIVHALAHYDFSVFPVFPGLYELIPWAELESAAACEDNPEDYLK